MDHSGSSKKKPSVPGADPAPARQGSGQRGSSRRNDIPPEFSSQFSYWNRKNRPKWLRKFFSQSWSTELRQIRRSIQKGTSSKEQVFSAVNRLMAKGLKADAIRLLYELRYYREAADILRAVGATSEAARLYVKAKCFEQAENSYTVIGDWMNAARCAMAMGKYDKAAPIFEEAREWEGAARCYRRMGKWRRAAFFYGLAGRNTDSIRCWREWMRVDKSALDIELTKDEINIIIKLMADGKFESILFQILDAHGQVSTLVFALMKRNRMSMAAEIYDSRFREISPDLCAWVRTNPEIAGAALSLCELVNDERGIADLYEQTNRLHEAVERYEAIGDLEAAYACALKCEWWDKIATLKVLLGRRDKGPDGHVPAKTHSIAKNADATEHMLPHIPGVPVPTELPKVSEIPVLSRQAGLPDLPSTLSFMSAPKEISLDDDTSSFTSFELTNSTEIAPAFVESRFFNQLNSDDRMRLWDIGSIVSYRAGDTIVEAGTVPGRTFTLLEGIVEIYRQEGRLERFVDRIRTGQNFGESWLMVNLKAEVRIVAATDCHLHVIERSGLERLMASEQKNTSRIISQIAQAVCSHLLHRFGVGMAAQPAEW